MKKNIPNPKEIKQTTWAPGFRRYPSKPGHSGNDNPDPFDDSTDRSTVAITTKKIMQTAKSIHINGTNTGVSNLNPDEDRPE